MPEGEWFDDWIEHHSTVFGMDREQDLAMFDSWRRLFLEAGYTRGELFAATDWLAVNQPPASRWRHLAALQERIRESRKEAARAREFEAVSYPDCPDCGGSGWVSVPDLREVRDMEWHGYQTAAVLCSCGWGRRGSERQAGSKPERRSMSLPAYQQHNPHWREQLAARKAFEKARAAAHAATAAADRLFGPLVRRIARKVAERGRGEA